MKIANKILLLSWIFGFNTIFAGFNLSVNFKQDIWQYGGSLSSGYNSTSSILFYGGSSFLLKCGPQLDSRIFGIQILTGLAELQIVDYNNQIVIGNGATFFIPACLNINFLVKNIFWEIGGGLLVRYLGQTVSGKFSSSVIPLPSLSFGLGYEFQINKNFTIPLGVHGFLMLYGNSVISYLGISVGPKIYF